MQFMKFSRNAAQRTRSLCAATIGTLALLAMSIVNAAVITVVIPVTTTNTNFVTNTLFEPVDFTVGSISTYTLTSTDTSSTSVIFDATSTLELPIYDIVPIAQVAITDFFTSSSTKTILTYQQTLSAIATNGPAYVVSTYIPITGYTTIVNDPTITIGDLRILTFTTPVIPTTTYVPQATLDISVISDITMTATVVIPGPITTVTSLEVITITNYTGTVTVAQEFDVTVNSTVTNLTINTDCTSTITAHVTVHVDDRHHHKHHHHKHRTVVEVATVTAPMLDVCYSSVEDRLAVVKVRAGYNVRYDVCQQIGFVPAQIKNAYEISKAANVLKKCHAKSAWIENFNKRDECNNLGVYVTYNHCSSYVATGNVHEHRYFLCQLPLVQG